MPLRRALLEQLVIGLDLRGGQALLTDCFSAGARTSAGQRISASKACMVSSIILIFPLLSRPFQAADRIRDLRARPVDVLDLAALAGFGMIRCRRAGNRFPPQ